MTSKSHEARSASFHAVASDRTRVSLCPPPWRNGSELRHRLRSLPGPTGSLTRVSPPSFTRLSDEPHGTSLAASRTTPLRSAARHSLLLPHTALKWHFAPLVLTERRRGRGYSRAAFEMLYVGGDTGRSRDRQGGQHRSAVGSESAQLSLGELNGDHWRPRWKEVGSQSIG